MHQTESLLIAAQALILAAIRTSRKWDTYRMCRPEVNISECSKSAQTHSKKRHVRMANTMH